jgi:hypothetical protein
LLAAYSKALTAFLPLLRLASLLLLVLLQVKFKLSKINAKDDSIRGLHRLLFNRDGTVRRPRSAPHYGCTTHACPVHMA